MYHTKYYNSEHIPAIFNRNPTRVIYPTTVDSIPQGSLIQIIKGSDLNLRGRVVQLRISNIRASLEDGSLKTLKPSQIRLIDPDNELRDSSPIPRLL